MFHVTKVRDIVRLIKERADSFHRRGGIYNLNILGLSSQIILQWYKQNELNGETVGFIFNGWALSMLEMMSNLQSERNSARRVIDKRTGRSSEIWPEKCPADHKHSPENASTGRMLINTDTAPSHSSATLTQHASSLTTRTIRPPDGQKPFFGKLNSGGKAITSCHEQEEKGGLWNAAEKTLPPNYSANLRAKKKRGMWRKNYLR